MKMRKRKEGSRFEGEDYCIKPIPFVAALCYNDASVF